MFLFDFLISNYFYLFEDIVGLHDFEIVEWDSDVDFLPCTCINVCVSVLLLAKECVYLEPVTDDSEHTNNRCTHSDNITKHEEKRDFSKLHCELVL